MMMYKPGYNVRLTDGSVARVIRVFQGPDVVGGLYYDVRCYGHDAERFYVWPDDIVCRAQAQASDESIANAVWLRFVERLA
jgi:hypothetical protein